MKRVLLTYSLMFCLLHTFSNELAAQKKIIKEWPVNSSTSLTFTAKYQEVEMVFWNENKVKLEVVAHSDDPEVSSEDIAQKIAISSGVEGNNLSVSVTLQPGKSTSMWSWVFGNSCKKINMSIKDKLYIPNNLASLAVISNYSDIRSESIPMSFSLKSNYGDVVIDEIKKPVSISANYTDLKIRKADQLDLTSNYTDLKIDEVSSLKATCTYADITVQKLNKAFTGTNTYCEIKLRDIAKDFSTVKCTGVYSEYDINVNEAHPLHVDLQTRHGDIQTGALQLIKSLDEDDNGNYKYKAKTKSAVASSPVIQISGSYSEIALKKEL